MRIANRLADRMLNRLVGNAPAAAGCAEESWTQCYISGVCSSMHAKESCRTYPNCTTRCTHIGCC